MGGRAGAAVCDDSFDAATVGFGARNFSDLHRGIDEMARVVRPGGRVVILEITQPAREPLASFYRGGSTAPCRRSVGSPATPTPTATPHSVERFPGPHELAAFGKLRAARIRYVLTAGGIIALHVRGRVSAPSRGRSPIRSTPFGLGGEPLREAMAERRGALAGDHADRSGTPWRRSRPAASACGRCSSASHRACRSFAATGSSRPRWRSSSCTPRRSSTTTCSTTRPCGEAGRPCSPPEGAWRRPRPATCCSPARSPSWPRERAMTAAVRVLSHACAALAQGELLQRADAWKLDVTLERYLERCRLKTARCLLAAGSPGSRALGGRRGGAIESLGASAAIGVAFQLFDDVLDVAGPAEVTGKPRGADLLDGTVTLPLIIARERDRRSPRSTFERCRDPKRRRPSATGSSRQALSGSPASAPSDRRCRQASAPALPERQRRRSSWWPMASSSVTRKAGAVLAGSSCPLRSSRSVPCEPTEAHDAVVCASRGRSRASDRPDRTRMAVRLPGPYPRARFAPSETAVGQSRTGRSGRRRGRSRRARSRPPCTRVRRERGSSRACACRGRGRGRSGRQSPGEDSGADPLAIRAAERHAPVGATDERPVQRLHQERPAGAATAQVGIVILGPRRDRASAPRSASAAAVSRSRCCECRPPSPSCSIVDVRALDLENLHATRELSLTDPLDRAADPARGPPHGRRAPRRAALADHRVAGVRGACVRGLLLAAQRGCSTCSRTRCTRSSQADREGPGYAGADRCTDRALRSISSASSQLIPLFRQVGATLSAVARPEAAHISRSWPGRPRAAQAPRSRPRSASASRSRSS